MYQRVQDEEAGVAESNNSDTFRINDASRCETFNRRSEACTIERPFLRSVHVIERLIHLNNDDPAARKCPAPAARGVSSIREELLCLIPMGLDYQGIPTFRTLLRRYTQDSF